MKTIFENCTITYSEYEYFKSLSNFDKLNYMFGLIETNSIKNDFNLNKFFELIHDITDSKFNSINNQISEKNHNAVDVTITLESVPMPDPIPTLVPLSCIIESPKVVPSGVHLGM